MTTPQKPPPGSVGSPEAAAIGMAAAAASFVAVSHALRHDNHTKSVAETTSEAVDDLGWLFIAIVLVCACALWPWVAIPITVLCFLAWGMWLNHLDTPTEDEQWWDTATRDEHGGWTFVAGPSSRYPQGLAYYSPPDRA